MIIGVIAIIIVILALFFVIPMFFSQSFVGGGSAFTPGAYYPEGYEDVGYALFGTDGSLNSYDSSGQLLDSIGYYVVSGSSIYAAEEKNPAIKKENLAFIIKDGGNVIVDSDGEKWIRKTQSLPYTTTTQPTVPRTSMTTTRPTTTTQPTASRTSMTTTRPTLNPYATAVSYSTTVPTPTKSVTSAPKAFDSMNFNTGGWTDVTSVFAHGTDVIVATNTKNGGTATATFWLSFAKSSPDISLSICPDAADPMSGEQNYANRATIDIVSYPFPDFLMPSNVPADMTKDGVPQNLQSQLNTYTYVYRVKITAPDGGYHSSSLLRLSDTPDYAIGTASLDSTDSYRAILAAYGSG
ncbi:MAG: hypothetical protein NTW33_03245 [Methanoregula sp.]|nr:hypothetical protein [Methanoregula sp.]